MSTHSPQGQPYPELHQKKCDQHVKGSDSAPLLHSGDISPGILHPDLGPSAQGRYGHVGSSPEEGHKSDLRAGAPLL